MPLGVVQEVQANQTPLTLHPWAFIFLISIERTRIALAKQFAPVSDRPYKSPKDEFEGGLLLSPFVKMPAEKVLKMSTFQADPVILPSDLCSFNADGMRRGTKTCPSKPGKHSQPLFPPSPPTSPAHVAGIGVQT